MRLPAGGVMYLGVDRGLSNGCVKQTAEDGRGNIWQATENGINRWDGKRFRSYMPGHSGLTTSEFSSIIKVKNDDNNLWAGSEREGVFRIDCNTYEMERVRFDGLRSVDISSLTPGPEGGMWIAHYYYSAQFFDPANNKIYKPVAERVEGLPSSCRVASQSVDGKVYVGHVREGFSVVDTVAKKFVNYRYPQIPDNRVYAICVDNNENVWIGTNSGAAVYNPVTGKITMFIHRDGDPGSIGAGAVNSIRLMKNGELWFGTSRDGVSILNLNGLAYSDIAKARFKSLPSDYAPDGTSSSNISDIFQDSYDNIWIGNYRTGLDFISHLAPLLSRVNYTGTGFTGHYPPVWCAGTDTNGQVWFGTDGSINQLDRQGNVSESVTLPGGTSFPRSILPDVANGRVWVGTGEDGLLVYDMNSGVWKRVGGVKGLVRALTIRGEDIYIGTVQGVAKVSRTGDAARLLDNVNDRLYDKLVNTVSFDKEGRMWVGTFGKGLYIFDSACRLLAIHQTANGFPSNTIHDVAHDAAGGTWAATRRGLVRFENGGYRNYHRIASVDSQNITHVMSLAIDGAGQVWIAGGTEIMCLDPGNEQGSVYSGTPNLPLNSFLDYSAARDAGNDIYFASINGLVRVSPNVLHTSFVRTGVMTNGLTAFGSGIDRSAGREIIVRNGKATVPYDENTLEVTFATPDMGQMSYSEFAYRLSGRDENWTEIPGDNMVRFNSLSPGTYKLMIRQRVLAGEWGAPVEALRITVTPPFWLSWWAKTIYVLAACGIAILIYSLARHRHVVKRELLMETERNKSAQMLNEERLKFYTNVTHELRTPLTLIMGPLEDIVSDPSLPAKFSYKLNVMRNSADSLMQLINGILEFRKTETLNRRLTVRRGVPADLFREICLRFKELNHNRKVNIIIDIEQDSPSMLYDKDIITTIVNNLVSNAVKYTPSGTITLGYHTVVSADGSRRTEMSVADTGYGISKEAQAHIFERYYQANGAHQASGTGIGLEMVKKLVDLHHGTLSLESEEGKGSTFTFILDTDAEYLDAMHVDVNSGTRGACPETSAQGPEDRTEGTGQADSAKRSRILVVEDNDDIREYIRRTLVDDAEVIVACNGLEGLNAAHQSMPDMVISDIMMPEMDGITLCRSIKEDVITSHIPVILLTAKDTLDDKEEGYESGADSYITKPFSAKLLRSRIHNLLMSRRRMAEYLLRQTAINKVEVVSGDCGNDMVPPAADDGCDSSDAADSLSPLDREFLDKLVRVIESNIDNENLSVSFLADKMCMSNSTLYRKITALLGVSPNEYVRQMRLARAVELMKERRYSLGEIAFSVGFGSLSSFSKVFKKEFGVTPSEYMNTKLTDKNS